MDHVRSIMAVAMTIGMSMSYCEVRNSSLTISRMEVVQAASERQEESPDAKKRSDSINSPGLDKLPEGKGRDVTVRVCTKCHSASVFVVQRHNLEGWYNVIDQMTGKGLQASDQDIEIVAQYLAASFPAATTAPQKSRNESRANLWLSSLSPSER